MSDNQHYISKSYLDKFIHPTSTQQILFPYTREWGPQKPRGTKILASDDSFYRQTHNGSLTNMLDEARKRCETMFFASGKHSPAPLAKCIFDDLYTPSLSDKMMLAGTAGFLWSLSPVQIHNTAMLMLLAHQLNVFNDLATDAAKEKLKEEYGPEADQKLMEMRQALWKGELYVDVGEENWRQLGFNCVHVEEQFIKGLCAMGMTVCHSHPNSFFITSDNPVVVTCPSQPDFPGIGVKDAEVWFPISYNRGILWSWKQRAIERTTLGHSETRKQNRKIIRWSYRDVCSPLSASWIATAIRENSFNPCYGHYGSLQQVVEKHSFNVKDENGNIKELVNLLSALRTGEKCDVVQLRKGRRAPPSQDQRKEIADSNG